MPRRRADAVLDEGAGTGDASLDRVICALTAPPSASELAGEPAAHATFVASVAARTVTDPVSRVPTPAARRFAVLGLVAGLVASGGLAYASSGGKLPDLVGGSAPASSAASPVGDDRAAAVGPGPTPADRPGDKAGHGPGDKSGDKPGAAPTAPPVPADRGLCRAYQARGTTVEPAFAALVERAGGRAKVAAYCVALIGPPGSGSEPKGNGQTTTPATRPTSPVRPARPTQAVEPSRPATPTQAANPSRPPRPSQAASPQATPGKAPKIPHASPATN